MCEITDTFTFSCYDCTKTIRVFGGRQRWHWCRIPRHLRGRAADAWADGEQWVLDHLEDYGLKR